VLVDASELGTKIKEGKNQKTLLSPEEEQLIIDAVNNQSDEDGFSVVKTFDELKAGKYSFNPGGYFDVKIEYVDMTADEFAEKMNASKTRLAKMFSDGKMLEDEIIKSLGALDYIKGDS
jgi:type I restriction enzyme M protein